VSFTPVRNDAVCIVQASWAVAHAHLGGDTGPPVCYICAPQFPFVI